MARLLFLRLRRKLPVTSRNELDAPAIQNLRADFSLRKKNFGRQGFAAMQIRCRLSFVLDD